MFVEATAYEDTMGRWSRILAADFCRFVDFPDQGQILDVGCGTGALIEELSKRTCRANLMGIDPSSSFIEYARKRLDGDRHRFIVGDACHMPFDTASVNGCASSLVLMLISDPRRLASEMCRVTCKRGVVAACTWDVTGMEMIEIVWDEAMRLDDGAQAFVRRPVQCNRKGELSELWTNLGLADVTEVPMRIQTPFASFEDFWLPFEKGAGTRTGAYIQQLQEDHKSALRGALFSRLCGSSSRAFCLSALAWAVKGTVPA